MTPSEQQRRLNIDTRDLSVKVHGGAQSFGLPLSLYLVHEISNQTVLLILSSVWSGGLFFCEWLRSKK